MGWMETARDACYLMLCRSFGLASDSANAMKRFVPAYLFQATTPQADRNVNVCYYDVRPNNEEGFRYTETSYAPKGSQGSNATIERSIPFTVLFTFYGPDADNDSEHFWSLCQSDIDYNSVRPILRARHIAFSGRPEFPVGLDQIEGTFIRRRCDVRVNFSIYESVTVPYSAVEQVPEINTTLDVESILELTNQENQNTEEETPSENTNDPGENTGNSSDAGEGNSSENPSNPGDWIIPQY